MPDDGPLPLARRRLSDAVHALADPIPQWVGGVCRWSGPLYDRLRVELAGGRVVGRRRVHGPRLPCRGDVLALLVEIDAAVASWQPDGKGTVDRLRLLAGRGWRPQDCELIDDHCAQLERWTLTGTELLAETPRVFLRQPCPRCGARFTYRRNDTGESVRVRCLRVSEAPGNRVFSLCADHGGNLDISERQQIARN